ncbi:MAG: SDR family oxidoreductase [Candidatus Micrarchaeia archaeon]
MPTLVIGASGLVGYEFYRQNKGKKGWFFTYRSVKVDDFLQLDASDAGQAEKLVSELKPDTVILPAAMAWVDKCEREPELARKNNVELLQNVIDAMKRHGGRRIVFFSTDYLFDGKGGPYSEDAEPNPLNVYGKIKLECERMLENSGLDYIILRTTGIFGWEKQGKNFLYRIFDTLGKGKPIEVPNDQYATPTYVKDIVGAAMALLEKGQTGTFNVVGPQYMNRVELSQKFAKGFGFDGGLIVGKPTSEFKSAAPRPMKAGFRIDKILGLGIRMRTVEEAVEDMKRRKEEDDKYE